MLNWTSVIILIYVAYHYSRAKRASTEWAFILKEEQNIAKWEISGAKYFSSKFSFYNNHKKNFAHAIYFNIKVKMVRIFFVYIIQDTLSSRARLA